VLPPCVSQSLRIGRRHHHNMPALVEQWGLLLESWHDSIRFPGIPCVEARLDILERIWCINIFSR
jgi:hypothetical protein